MIIKRNIAKQCLSIQKVTELYIDIIILKINSSWALFKKMGSLHYIIKYDGKVRKRHLNQMPHNYIISSKSSHDSSDIVSEVAAIRQWVLTETYQSSCSVSQDLARCPVASTHLFPGFLFSTNFEMYPKIGPYSLSSHRRSAHSIFSPLSLLILQSKFWPYEGLLV